MMKKPTKSEYGNFVYSFYMSKKENLASIKGCNSATNFLKMTLYNYNLDLIDVNVYIQNLVKFLSFFDKILNKTKF